MQRTVRRTAIVGAALVIAAVASSVALHSRSERSTAVTTPAVVTSVSTTSVAGATVMNGVTAADLTAFRATAPGTTMTVAQLEVGALTRQYLVIAPITRSGPLPVLVVLSGSDASVVTEAGRDQLVALAQQGQAVVVYPSSYTADLTWNAVTDGCCQNAGARQIPDAAFVAALVPVLKTSYGTSTADLIGFSNGGKLGYTLTCQSPRLFAAVAIVAAVPLTQCAGPPVPILIALGSADDREPRETAISAVSATIQLENAVAYWRQRDGCTSTAATSAIGVATLTTWSGCSNRSQVQQVLWAGVGHVWPRSNDIGAPASAATLTWAFLSKAG
jgi:poly(3-hydroxybutyrate) depolymerase